MRKLPSLPQESKLLPTTTKTVYPIVKYDIHLVTLLFGGGYQAGEVDKDHPIRISTIRGQLRFWWRAIRGAAFTNAYDLRKREVEIFGDTDHASPIKMWVEQVQGFVHPQSDSLYPRYVFQDKLTREKCLKDGRFTLCIEYTSNVTPLSELETDINAALWGWINFGGIGMRTRRGCGSLYCTSFSPTERMNANELMRWLEQQLHMFQSDFQVEDTQREWPILSGTFTVSRQAKPILETKVKGEFELGAWKNIIEAYQKFRQRKASSNRMGRSAWMEPDVLRHVMGMKEEDHATPFPESKSEELIAFPRAQFGLPINTQFKQDAKLKLDTFFSKNAEPYPTQLLPKGKTRLASPLILKPIAVSPTQGFSAIIVLNQPPLEEVELHLNPSQKTPKTRTLKQQQHWDAVKNRLKELRITAKHIYPASSDHPTINYKENPILGYSSAIDAFLNSKEVRAFFQHPTNRKS